jgi:phosphoenolpyruvate carboxylase
LGAAAEQYLGTTSHRDLLQSMYREWPFFRATVDNAELALAKTDLGIAEHYAGLADDSESLARIGSMIADEFRRTRAAILEITGNAELLDGTPWLKESIRVRNRYLDPLNLIQVELLRRLQECSDADESQIEELRHLTRLTISGLAAGMRTSG